MITLLLAGKSGEARAQARPAQGAELAAMPGFTLTDLEGRPLARESLAGRPVLVEFWATWCPPCRGTLEWLGELEKRHGDRLEVVAVAIESDEPDVRKILIAQGNDVIANTPEEFARVIQADAERWGGIGRMLGVKLD